ncbi:MAG TPA: hypothetical protein VIX73_08105, partial [Kofleriaceae bacterium]
MDRSRRSFVCTGLFLAALAGSAEAAKRSVVVEVAASGAGGAGAWRRDALVQTLTADLADDR